jgi:hypothetical protein
MHWRKRAVLIGAALLTAALLALIGRWLMEQPVRTPGAPGWRRERGTPGSSSHPKVTRGSVARWSAPALRSPTRTFP